MARGLQLTGALLAGSLTILAGPVRAGSVTVESIFSERAARQLAISQIPSGATLRRVTCQDIEVRGDDRYRCTAFFTRGPGSGRP